MLLNKIPSRGIPELDTLRFVSVTLVITHHLFFESNPVFKWLSVHAYVGVDIFFTLSGLIITKGLIREWRTKGTLNLRNFWIKRMIRIWPAWLFTMFLSAVGVILLSKNSPTTLTLLKDKWWHYFLHFGNYSHAFTGKIHTLFSHFWSLAVEEHFYLIWPPIFLLIHRYKKLRFFFIPLLIIVPYLFRVLHKVQGYENIVGTFSTHTRIDSIFLGCFLAMFIDQLPKVTSVLKDSLLWGLGVVVMYIGLELKFYPGSYWISESAHFFRSCATVTFIFLLMNGSERGVRKFWRSSTLSKLGVLSYSAYLLHFMFNTAVFTLDKKLGLNLSQITIMLICTALIYIPAYLNYRFVEHSFEGLKKHLT